MNQQEKNRQTLKDAIGRLPGHQAPADLWTRLEQKLDEHSPGELHRETLEEAIAGLPQQETPGRVWNRLERALDGRRSRRWAIPAVSLAATLALLLVVWIALPGLEYVPPIAETESTFVMPTEASLTEWQHSRELEEQRVFACVDSVSSDSLTIRYGQITSALDSLAILLQEPEAHDATLGRFQRLEASRRQTLARIEQEHCSEAQP